MTPVLTVLLWSSVAAASAGLGGLLLVGRERPPAAWLGWANAVAAGLMLGSAYALTVDGFERAPLSAVAGAVLGTLVVAASHRLGGTADLELNRLGDTRAEYGYEVLLVQSFHSAWEGVAIGVAAVLSLGFGVFMAGVLAVHNVAEALILVSVLRSRGVRAAAGSGLAVLTNVPQLLLAVVTYSVLAVAPGALPWVLGFAVGALVQLVLVELLAEAYREAGPGSIAVVTSLAMGVIALLQGIAF